MIDEIISLLRDLKYMAPDCYMGRIDDAERELIEIRRMYGTTEKPQIEQRAPS